MGAQLIACDVASFISFHSLMLPYTKTIHESSGYHRQKSFDLHDLIYLYIQYTSLSIVTQYYNHISFQSL